MTRPVVICRKGEPVMGFLTTGENPTRMQAEAEGWGCGEMSDDGIMAIRAQSCGAFRVAIYCCSQHAALISAERYCPAGAEFTIRLTPGN